MGQRVGKCIDSLPPEKEWTKNVPFISETEEERISSKYSQLTREEIERLKADGFDIQVGGSKRSKYKKKRKTKKNKTKKRRYKKRKTKKK